MTVLAKLIPILILLNSCASIGMSQNFDDCYRFEEGFGKDVVTGVGKAVSRKQMCIKGPVIQPSATDQLLNFLRSIS